MILCQVNAGLPRMGVKVHHGALHDCDHDDHGLSDDYDADCGCDDHHGGHD